MTKDIESTHLTEIRKVGIDLHEEREIGCNGYFWNEKYFYSIIESRADGLCILPSFNLEESNEKNFNTMRSMEQAVNRCMLHYIETLGGYIYKEIDQKVEELTAVIPYEADSADFQGSGFLHHISAIAEHFHQPYFIFSAPGEHETALYKWNADEKTYRIEKELGLFETEKMPVYYDALRKDLIKEDAHYEIEGYYSPGTFMGAMARLQEGCIWQPSRDWSLNQ